MMKHPGLNKLSVPPAMNSCAGQTAGQHFQTAPTPAAEQFENVEPLSVEATISMLTDLLGVAQNTSEAAFMLADRLSGAQPTTGTTGGAPYESGCIIDRLTIIAARFHYHLANTNDALARAHNALG